MDRDGPSQVKPFLELVSATQSTERRGEERSIA